VDVVARNTSYSKWCEESVCMQGQRTQGPANGTRNPFVYRGKEHKGQLMAWRIRWHTEAKKTRAS